MELKPVKSCFLKQAVTRLFVCDLVCVFFLSGTPKSREDGRKRNKNKSDQWENHEREHADFYPISFRQLWHSTFWAEIIQEMSIVCLLYNNYSFLLSILFIDSFLIRIPEINLIPVVALLLNWSHLKLRGDGRITKKEAKGRRVQQKSSDCALC